MTPDSARQNLALVTGGAGFIGGHVVEALLAAGLAVRVLDYLAPPVHTGGVPDWFPPAAEFIKGDVRRKEDWERALVGVDYVFNIAGYMDFHPDYSTYIATNAASTALLFEVIHEKNLPIKKVIASSSQGVYGEGKYKCRAHGVQYPAPRSAEQLESKDWEARCPLDNLSMEHLLLNEDDPLKPVNLYGVSKQALEGVLLQLGREHGIPVVALRYSIVHGPRQTFRHFYSGALRHFAVSALAGQPFHIHEDGRQLRDFVHIKDVVAAHLLVLQDERANNQIFNVGAGQAYTVEQLARTVAEVCGVPFERKAEVTYRAGTARHTVSDVSKLKNLGWRPQRTLRDNVVDYVDWVRQYPEAKEYLKKHL